MAFLPNFGFDGIDESSAEKVLAFIHKDQVSEGFEDKLAGAIPVPFDLAKEPLADQNWNAVWESNFDPVFIDDFCCIRASFHAEAPDFDHEIIIDPRMAFGTGHHETTAMVIKHMRTIDLKNKQVFDYGCGTGVLAILAEQRGAHAVLAIDYDINSSENTEHNVMINKCSKINVQQAELDDLPAQKFDVILANINKNVLKSAVNKLPNFLVNDGVLIMSGILNTDESEMVQLYESQGFIAKQISREGEWIAVKFIMA